jgi:hypothetical protein
VSTTFYLATCAGSDTTPPGALSTDIDLLARLTRDSGAAAGTTNSVAGGTTVPMTFTPAGNVLTYWTNPLNAVSLSGTVTYNLWMSESNLSANVGAGCIIWHTNIDGLTIDVFASQGSGIELPLTTRAAQNYTGAPNVVSVNKGDRLKIVPYGFNVGVMASGFTFDIAAGASSSAVDGDSFITLTETVTEYFGDGLPNRFVAAPFIPQGRSM